MSLIPDPAVQPTIPVWPTAGKLLGISKPSAYAAAAAGEIPVIKVGRRLVVPTAVFLRMLGLDGHEGDHHSSSTVDGPPEAA